MLFKSLVSKLKIASATVLGGIKVGDNLTIEPDGKLNATSTDISGKTGLCYITGMADRFDGNTYTYNVAAQSGLGLDIYATGETVAAGAIPQMLVSM